MTTVAEIITSARWDLRDEDETQYSDAMLLDFLNRGLRALITTLSSLRSDWLNDDDNIILASSATSTALPDYFISDITVTIGTTKLTKKSISQIREEQLFSSTGEPSHYAISGLNLHVERAADQEYTIILEYNKGLADLVSGDMPYNNEFNDVLRQSIILIAKSRNEYSLIGDAALQDFFISAVMAKLVARNFIPNTHRTSF